jgi:hypothetical protein
MPPIEGNCSAKADLVASRSELRRSPAVAEALLPPAEAGYSGGTGEQGMMRAFAVTVGVLAVFAAQAGSADAATRRQPAQPPAMRTASGTVIQPSRTIIHDQYGRTTVIVIPRRSYLDTGTEVSIGDRKFTDYAFPPGGDPGRSEFWFIGPDFSGANGYPLPRAFVTPGAPF